MMDSVGFNFYWTGLGLVGLTNKSFTIICNADIKERITVYFYSVNNSHVGRWYSVLFYNF